MSQLGQGSAVRAGGLDMRTYLRLPAQSTVGLETRDGVVRLLFLIYLLAGVFLDKKPALVPFAQL